MTNELHELAKRLFPICRSLTGRGVRETLEILSEIVPLQLHEVPSGEVAFDWKVPAEWNITDAWIKNSIGEKLIDFKKSNLHVVGYSAAIRRKMPLSDLQPHLYSIPDQPTAVPYVTSYYKETWGFCLTENQRQTLKDGEYEVCIESSLLPGSLTYADLVIPGETDEEVLFSTYICHPSLANNELSGPVVAIHLAKWILSLQNRRYTYRFVFIPETIGSIIYLSRNLSHMKAKTKAGYVLTCIGDDLCYSFLSSRKGNTLADRVARHVLGITQPDYKAYDFTKRGSDERQYCAPGIDLPIASLMRSKYGEYPQYHTSLDDLSFVTPAGLAGGLEVCKLCVRALEVNRSYLTQVLGEPQLGKRGLYPSLSRAGRNIPLENMMNVLAYSDGETDLLSIAEMSQQPIWEFEEVVASLSGADLIKEVGR